MTQLIIGTAEHAGSIIYMYNMAKISKNYSVRNCACTMIQYMHVYTMYMYILYVYVNVSQNIHSYEKQAIHKQIVYTCTCTCIIYIHVQYMYICIYKLHRPQSKQWHTHVHTYMYMYMYHTITGNFREFCGTSLLQQKFYPRIIVQSSGVVGPILAISVKLFLPTCKSIHPRKCLAIQYTYICQDGSGLLVCLWCLRYIQSLVCLCTVLHIIAHDTCHIIAHDTCM